MRPALCALRPQRPGALPLTHPEIPRLEHPRPDFMREPWINLNGPWRFTLDPENLGEQQRWYRRAHPDLAGSRPYHDPFGATILVPFPWESELSGIRVTDYKGAAWYQRTILVPADWAEDGVGEAPEAAALPLTGGDGTIPSAPGALRAARWRLRPFLCFGAVDWNAKVWVDGRFVAEHDGGYTPFFLDLSRYLHAGRPATLTLRAWDVCAADTLLGKQTYDWYTHSGGIWQPVWLEGRPGAHLSGLRITPHLREGSATFAVEITADEASAGVYRLEVR